MSSPFKNGDESRTVLWCVPRAISTAFAKCLSYIEDTEVWFEPYVYTYMARVEYELHSKLVIPKEYEGNEETFQKVKEMVDLILQSKTEADRLPYGSVKRRLEASTAKHVFVKDMAFGVPDGYRQFLPKGYRHTFLIRNPLRSIYSYRKSMFKQFSELGLLEGDAADESTYDLERHDRYFAPGYFVKEVYDLWKYLQDSGIDPNPLIIDGDDLLTKPAETLSAYCAAVGLPYNDSLLQWDESVEAFKKMKASGDNVLMDVVNFYGTAMKSSCFFPASKPVPRDQLPADVIRCSEKVMAYFDEMYEARIKV
ncbi:branched-chain-amino-acid aminotransferase-like protein 1 [Lytechinus variegatus]|uniref:branched-chain-amino-acid aminotransferase-like protein 1 n=1 Tax=Lytechinus variegatus TaxID=7654 RepID=UPI001BB26D71|nr:branched-chain-amino-acid aminotransferase-like protein 1 [Lytechinus variegatus]